MVERVAINTCGQLASNAMTFANARVTYLPLTDVTLAHVAVLDDTSTSIDRTVAGVVRYPRRPSFLPDLGRDEQRFLVDVGRNHVTRPLTLRK